MEKQKPKFLEDKIPEEYEQIGLPFIVSMSRSWYNNLPEKIAEEDERRRAFRRALNMEESKNADAIMVGIGEAKVTHGFDGCTMGYALFYFPVVAYKKKK